MLSYMFTHIYLELKYRTFIVLQIKLPCLLYKIPTNTFQNLAECNKVSLENLQDKTSHIFISQKIIQKYLDGEEDEKHQEEEESLLKTL